jgi:hypothetical protein
MRFFINFLKALGIFTGYGLGTYLVFELLKAHAIWIMPYLIWILLGLFIICICALAASWACHMEDNE